MTKLLFLLNTKAGAGDLESMKELIDNRLMEEDVSYSYYGITGDNDAMAIRKKVLTEKPDKVVAVGGDGTINLAGSQLIDTGTELGIIPAGSANGLAYNLNIPNAAKDALEIVLHGQAKPIDVLQINDRIRCFHLADIGINARIVKRFEEEGSKGLAGYAKQLLKELRSERTSFCLQMEVDGIQQKKMQVEMLVIANAGSYGTGARINPEGKMDDGRFELVVIRPYPWWIVFYFIYVLLTGRLRKMKYARIFSCKKAIIRLTKPEDIQIDGEPEEHVSLLRVEVLEKAVRVLSP